MGWVEVRFERLNQGGSRKERGGVCEGQTGGGGGVAKRGKVGGIVAGR